MVGKTMKRLLLLLVSLILALSCRQAPVPVIFDTDMGNDIDDALALAMLYRYVDEGKIDLLGIASSNSTELIKQVLSSHGIMDKFQSIKSGTQVVKGKPAPDIYLTVADELGAEPSKCLVFEDLVDGIKAAKNAGMTVVAVSDDYSRHSDDLKKELADDYIEDFWGYNNRT